MPFFISDNYGINNNCHPTENVIQVNQKKNHVDSRPPIYKNLIRSVNEQTDAFAELLNKEKISQALRWKSKLSSVGSGLWEWSCFASIVNEIIEGLSKINSTKISFEKTLDDSILIKAKKGNINYFIEIFADDESPLKYNAYLNAYRQKRIIASESDSLNKIFLTVASFEHEPISGQVTA